MKINQMPRTNISVIGFVIVILIALGNAAPE